MQLPAWVQQEDEEPLPSGFSSGPSSSRRVEGDEFEEEDEEDADRARRRERGRRRYEAEVVEEGVGEKEEEEEVERKPVVVDRRLARLEEARRVAQEGRSGGRRRYEAEVMVAEEEQQQERSEGERPEEEASLGLPGCALLPWFCCCV